jgi:gas vesicle structural protein
MSAATTFPAAHPTGSVARRPASGSLAEVIDIILDKGLVLDVYARVSLVGIELLTIDVRVVIASVDTYLHFAEATNRLDLRGQAEERDQDLGDLVGTLRGGGASTKTKGAIEGAGQKASEAASGTAEKIKSVFGSEDEGEGEEQSEEDEDS